MSIVLNWNGDEIPEQVRQQMPAGLQRLPPGRYVLDAIDEVPELSAEEETGIRAAMGSVKQGKGVSLHVGKSANRPDPGSVKITLAPEADRGGGR